MSVSQAEYDCRNAIMQELEAYYYFDIPQAGQQRTDVVFDVSTDFISAPIAGCSQSYRLEMVDGGALPGYYSFSQLTGVLSVTTDANSLFSDDLRIVISSTDGVVNRQLTSYAYPYEQVTATFTVAARCGIGSTTIVAPTLGTLEQHANAADNRLQLNAEFVSTNPRCPIITTTLLDGFDRYDLTPTIADPQTPAVGAGFDQYVTTTFLVGLKNTFITVVDDYPYTVQAIAQGGASGRAAGMMSVTPAEYDCTGAFVGVP